MGLINPWDFIPPGRNRKIARDTVELHCAKQNSEGLAENDWENFPNLEVLWLNSNNVVRIENLEKNFRIRELYLMDNRLVSLAGLSTFKFLSVLSASNNQLRNLDKQLSVLSRFAFLKKLDLFGNPVSEEPEYRFRVIYHMPQVELLDLKTVKHHERVRADDVVPELERR